jgi:Ribonuclease G/E
VESRILYGKLVEKLDSMNIHGCGEIVVRTRPELISKLIGQKKSNINAIKNRYALSDVKVLEDPEVESFEIQVKKEKENEDN